MSGINKVLLVGNLGGDPELRHTGSGEPFTGFTLATSRSWTDKQGQKQERTTWHRIVVWGKEAESCAHYLGKGSLVGVEGSLDQREYTDKDGQKQRIMEVRSQRVTFLGGGKKQTQSQGMAYSDAPLRGPEEPPPLTDADVPF